MSDILFIMKKKHRPFSFRKFLLLYELHQAQYPLTIREMVVQCKLLKNMSVEAIMSLVWRVKNEKLIEQVGKSYQITPFGEDRVIYLSKRLHDDFGGLGGYVKYIKELKGEKQLEGEESG